MMDKLFADTLTVLRTAGVLTIDMQEAFVRDNVQNVFFSTEKTVLIQHKCGTAMLWTLDTAEAVRALSDLRSSGHIVFSCVCHGDEAVEAVKQVFPEFKIDPPCCQYCRSSRSLIEFEQKHNIRPLTLDDAETVHAHYALEPDIDHIRKTISMGLMYGAEVDGKLAGFIGVHSDGSCGMLEVFPEFRRMGIGTELELYLQNEQLKKGFMPYGQVYTTNMASIDMQTKIGLLVSDEHVTWTYVED